jgi:hypothetical protein
MFYTYMWLREDGTPYYVGKGFGRRAFRKGGPKSRECIKLQHWPDEATAFAFERYLVDFYGRKDLGTGILRNLTDGGEGASGCKPSETTRLKMRTSALGKTCPSRGRKGKRPTEVGLKISASKMGHTTPKATRRKMSLAKIGNHNRIKVYENDAEKQRAYRLRKHKDTQ